MDLINNEKYLINKVRDSDPVTAKAWILAAKTLYPKDFGVQFEAYRLEKAANNHTEAAKCFSYIIVNFQNQSTELWAEISQLTAALKIPEGGTTIEQEFYVKIFQHMSFEVQHQILLLTANNTDNYEHCKLILLLLKRFPQAIPTHSIRLIEIIIQNIANNQQQFYEMLINDVIPLIYNKPPDLPSSTVTRIMAISFEYYVKQMFVVPPSNNNDTTGGTNAAIPINPISNDEKLNVIFDAWKNIFNILEMCGRILKWETFLTYNKNWSKDIYWQKLIHIVSAIPPRPSENKQILFYATILFVMSLQEYVTNVKHIIDDIEIKYILIEAFKEDGGIDPNRLQNDNTIEVPKISVNYPCTSEIPICLVTAAQCWQLLHSNDILQLDFSQLLMNLPLSDWINRFLLDLSVYLGRNEEANKLLQDTKLSNVEKNLRLLSLTMIPQSNYNLQGYDYLLKVITDLPKIEGSWIEDLTNIGNGRHLILLPLTKRAIIQYCTKFIVNNLKFKLLSDPSNCNDVVLGNLLVLLQLDWPNDEALAETIFNIIRQRRHFVYLQFPKYIICPDMIEEFMSMWYPHGGDVHLEFIQIQQQTLGTRRIGTRGADKGVKEDFKQIIRQQILRSNEDIVELIIQFIIDGEHLNSL